MFQWLKSLLNMPGDLHKGIDYIDNGQFSKGYDILLPLIEKNQKNDLLYQTFARALVGLKKSGKAVEYAEKACEIKPHNPANHGVLASVYIEIKEYDNAMKAIDCGLNADSKNAYLHFLKGLVYLKIEKPDLAINHFEEFMAFNHSISIARIFTMCETVLHEIRSYQFDMKKNGNSKKKNGVTKADISKADISKADIQKVDTPAESNSIKSYLGNSLFNNYEKGIDYLKERRFDEATMEFERICRKKESFVMARMLIFTELFFQEKNKTLEQGVFFKKI